MILRSFTRSTQQTWVALPLPKLVCTEVHVGSVILDHLITGCSPGLLSTPQLVLA